MPIELVNHQENRGLGETIKTGIHHCINNCDDRDIIITMDADNTHTPGLILRMVRYIWEGNDVVIASRYKPDARVKGISLFRRILSRGASILFQTFFPIKGVKDYTSGYRAYRAKCLKEAINKYGINEFPLILRYDSKGGDSKMNVSKTIRDTLLLMLNRFFR